MKISKNSNNDFVSFFYLVDIILKKKILFISIIVFPLFFGYLYLQNIPQNLGLKIFFNIELLKYKDRSRCKFESSINEVCIYQNYLNELLIHTDFREIFDIEIGKDHYLFKSDNLNSLNSIIKIIDQENEKITNKYKNELKLFLDIYNKTKAINLIKERTIINEGELIINNNEGELTINNSLGRMPEDEYIYKKNQFDFINEGRKIFEFSSSKLIKYPKISNGLVFFSLIFFPMFSLSFLIFLDYLKRRLE